jgi:hypothetical protein
MACSKIILGDLPELIKNIIQYLLSDYKTLYSCILVNRLWCRVAIPLLWEDPFSFPNYTKNYHFIEVYLYKLNEDDKIRLSEYGIISDLFSSSTLFNYPNFIKHFNIFNICRSIGIWKEAKKVEDENFIFLIYKLLLKIFIENGASLSTLVSFTDNNYFKIIFELISQNPNFICNIKNLELNSVKNSHYLEFLYSNCNSISFLGIHFYFHGANMKYFSQIINSRNLKKIKFSNASHKDFPLLQSLKNSNCSNTLNTIIFCNVNFKSVVNINFKEIFEQLNVLNSIHVSRCYYLNLGFIQHIVNITKSFGLRTLFLCEPLEIDLLQLLLQRFGHCLENFGFTASISLNEPEQELISKYCTKIKFLDLIGQDCQAMLNWISLIQNVSRLSITVYDMKLGSILLLNLGQVLPIKLDYLNMDLNSINKDDFEIFLKNSQNTFIEKLLIRNKGQIGYEDILPYIKEYIMKKKKVKYLALTGSSSEDSLKDKKKEFMLHNIIVSNYMELKINYRNFIDKLY